jgi:hypothetical protein
MNKYNVGAKEKRTYNGIVFDSIKEMNRYKDLLLLQSANKITGLERQPKFVLQEPFVYGQGKQRAIIYIADFKYHDKIKGMEIVEDVKAVNKKGKIITTEVYRIKKKLLLKKYWNINFIEYI